jgi:hypothetical protein
MLATSNKALKDLLHEAKDHKIIIEKTDDAGHIILFIPYPPLLLEKIVSGDLGDAD